MTIMVKSFDAISSLRTLQTVFLLTITCLSVVKGQSPQRFAIEPTDKTAIVGDTVILPCRVVNKVGTLQWTKDGFGLGTDRTLSGFPRYTMIGNDEEGDFSLQISNVQLEDDANFQCQVGAMDGVRGIRSRSAAFTVFVPPEPPTIVQAWASGSVLKTTAGISVELTCESNAGKPPAELTWLDADLNPVRTGVQTATQLMADGKRSNTVSRWSFVASKEMNGRLLTCRSENAAVKTPQNATIRMEVKFSPDVRLIAESHPNDQRIMPGNDVHLRCSATANPAKMVFKWFLEDQVIIGDHQSELILKNVTKEMNGKSVVCEVANTVGSTKAKFPLKIFYPPTFESPVESVVGAEPGSDVTLTCLVDGNPQPEITWLMQGSANVLGTGRQLVVKKLDKNKTGKYVCRASVRGFPEVAATTYLYMKGPPLLLAQQIQYGAVGDRTEVECLVESAAKPVKLVWMHNGMIIDIDNTVGYEVTEDQVISDDNMPLLKSTIIIHQTKETDLGLYNCSATNQYGGDWQVIRLIQPVDNFRYLLVTIGLITCSVILVIVMLLVVLSCSRKQRSSTYSGSYLDPVKNVDQMIGGSSNKSHQNIGHHEIDTGSSGTGSDMKVEIRTASSMSHRWDENYERVDVIDDHELGKINDLSNVIKNIYMYTNNSVNNIQDMAANNNGYVTFNHPNDLHSPIYTSQQLLQHQMQQQLQQQQLQQVHPHCSVALPVSDNHNHHLVMKTSPYKDTDYLKDYANPYQSMVPNVVPVEVSTVGNNHFLATHV